MMMPHGLPLNGAAELLQSQLKQLVQPAPLLKELTGLTELLPDAPFPASEQELGLEQKLRQELQQVAEYSSYRTGNSAASVQILYADAD